MDNTINSHQIVYTTQDLLQKNDLLLKTITSVPVSKRQKKSAKNILKEIDDSCKEMCDRFEILKKNSFK